MRTKKAFTITLIAAALVVGGALEAAYGLNVRLGPKIGLNFGWVGGRDFIEQLEMWDDFGESRRSPRMGFSGGLAFTLELIDYFALQPEFLYSSHGGRYEYTYMGIEVDGVQSAGVFEIPFYLKPRFPVGDGRGACGAVYALIGPSVALFVTDITTAEEAGGLKVEVESAPDNIAVLALSGGLGYEHVVGPGLLSIETRYSVSLTEIYEDFESNLSALSFMVGYAFDLAERD